jgi:hypothetical protein
MALLLTVHHLVLIIELEAPRKVFQAVGQACLMYLEQVLELSQLDPIQWQYQI